MSVVLYLLGSACVLLGYVFPYNLPPLVTIHMEFLLAAGWILLIAAYLQDARSTLVAVPRLTCWLIALPASLGLAACIDYMFGRNEYGGVLVLYIIFMALATSAIWLGSEVAARADAPAQRLMLIAFAGLICAAAFLNGIAALVQILSWEVPPWIVVRLPEGARAFGNIRQPNLYSLLLTLGVLASIGLSFATRVKTERGWQIALVLLAAFLGIASSFSSSRTGLLLMVVVAIFSMTGRGLPRLGRVMAVAAAAANVVGWFALTALGRAGQVNYSGLHRMDVSSGADFSSRRDDLWLGMIDVIRAHPIWGTGYSRLNYEYFNLDIPNRIDFNLQNAHNLPLQIAVEHGVIFALVWLALLCAFLWRARRTWSMPGARLFWLGLIAVGIHSCLELPLWYLYFLLPTGFALGAISGYANAAAGGAMQSSEGRAEISVRPVRSGLVGVVTAVALIATFAVWRDYSKILPTFSSGSPDEVATRFEAGYQTRLFLPWMDYAVVANTPVTPENAKLHYRISKRVSTFTIQKFIVINLALASAMLGRDDEAVFYLSRLKSFYGSKFNEMLAALTSEEQDLLRPALTKMNATQ